jgi:hypothetical protein
MIPSQRCFTCCSKYTRHKPFGQQYQAAAQTDGQTWKKKMAKMTLILISWFDLF